MTFAWVSEDIQKLIIDSVSIVDKPRTILNFRLVSKLWQSIVDAIIDLPSFTSLLSLFDRHFFLDPNDKGNYLEVLEKQCNALLRIVENCLHPIESIEPPRKKQRVTIQRYTSLEPERPAIEPLDLYIPARLSVYLVTPNGIENSVSLSVLADSLIFGPRITNVWICFKRAIPIDGIEIPILNPYRKNYGVFNSNIEGSYDDFYTLMEGTDKTKCVEFNIQNEEWNDFKTKYQAAALDIVCVANTACKIITSTNSNSFKAYAIDGMSIFKKISVLRSAEDVTLYFYGFEKGAYESVTYRNLNSHGKLKIQQHRFRFITILSPRCIPSHNT